MGSGYDVCRACGSTCAVSKAGKLRRHPKGSPDPCPGSGEVVGAPEPPSEPATPAPRPSAPVAVKVQPGLYRSGERMMDSGIKPLPGHAIVSIVAHIPYDGTNGRTSDEEAALLFEDPDYLYATLSKVPNSRIRLLLKVET